MPTGRFSSLPAAVLAAAAMTAAHAMPGMPAGHPAVSMPDRTLFELIAAGVAIHRNDPDFAYAAWMDAAQKEHNPEIAELAWQAAVASRQPGKALEAAQMRRRVTGLSVFSTYSAIRPNPVPGSRNSAMR